jgi:hypothetical protein
VTEVRVSTVLWANVLVEGKVVSDETDHTALYRHADKLDAIATSLGLPSFIGICDTTDQRFNVEDTDLPAGMTSTDEVMAVQGAWMPIADAVAMLERLRDHVVTRNVRFGLLSNQQPQVVVELDEVLAFAKGRSRQADRFNFSVVA